jgi:hypothetical protein
MRTVLAKTKLHKGIAVSSALLVGAGLGESAMAPPPDVRGSVQAISPESDLVYFDDDSITASETIPIQLPDEERKWSKSDAAKLRALAVKRAARTISPEENERFHLLQRRRRANERVSSEEVLSEWRRRKFVGEILQVLDRNVRFFKAEDKARLRTIRETARA